MRRIPAVRRILVVLVTLVGALVPMAVATSAAHAGTSTTRNWTVQVGNQSKDLAIQGMRFLPGKITINAGDSVTWKAATAEIHTVTFFPGGGVQSSLPEFNPADPMQNSQVGGSVYDSSKYFNSGLFTTVPTGGDAGPLPPVPHVQRYKLTFPHTGTFTYYCLVHGLMMVGTIHVQPHGSKYPFTQKQYNNRASVKAAAIIADGRRLQAHGLAASTNHHVFVGADDGLAMVMRFLRQTVRIHVGQSVTFDNNGMAAPHTVTFGQEPPPPALFNPSGDPTNYSGGDLNSGLLVPPSTFKVTFTKAGTFHYVCGLHDFMGMVGKVVVLK